MRILIAVHGFPPLQNAGAEKAAERIADWLAREGHQVEVFALNRLNQPDAQLETEIQNEIVVHRFSLNMGSGDEAYRNSYDHPQIGPAFAALLEQRKFDLVHLISGYQLAGPVIHAARQAGVPVVLTLTEYFFMCSRLNLMQYDASLCSGPTTDAKCARCLLEEKRRFRYLARYAPRVSAAYWRLATGSKAMRAQTAAVAARRQALKTAIEAADAVICPSRFIISKHEEYGFRTRDFVFIQHGLNRPPITPAGHPDEHSKQLRVGYMGQIKGHKGVDLLVDAVREMLDEGYPVELQVWGRITDQPDYSRRLMRESSDYPQIQWKGGFVGAQVWDVLAGLDVLVVPSRWYENCPTVILEAYVAGLPVIATNAGGMAELVEPGKSGLVFEMNRASDLREQLKRLVNETDLLEKLRAGIPYIKTGDEEVNQIYQLYLRVLAEHAAGKPA